METPQQEQQPDIPSSAPEAVPQDPTVSSEANAQETVAPAEAIAVQASAPVESAPINTDTSIEPSGTANAPAPHISEEEQRILQNLKMNSPHLPLSKIKKIAKTDPEFLMTSHGAFIATSFATELFIQLFTEKTLSLSQLHSKKNKNKRLVYADMAECVSKFEEYQFLGDVVPKTKDLKQLVKENKVRYTTQGSEKDAQDSSMI